MKILLIVMLTAVAGPGQEFSYQPGLAASAWQRIPIDIEQSIIHWRGTKMRGLGKHEGIVKLQSGFVVLQAGALTGGTFVIDMPTIQVTDIPESDPVPRRNLRNHLLHEDFFAVASYPTASLVITRARKEKEGEYLILGKLTIKAITRPIAFRATIENSAHLFSAHAILHINRQLWNVAFKGSRLQNNLVDDSIELNVLVRAKNP